jgi:hypothetical protein
MMRLPIVLAAALALFGVETMAVGQEMPEMPKPQKEHQWLAQLAGDWEADIEAQMGPGQPPMKAKATQSSTMLGDRWLVATSEGEMMGQPMTSVLTIGYDPAKKSYVGTFYCSCGNELWTYTGQVSDDGKKLVLDTEGPNMMTPGTTSKYQETIEIKDKDHYVFTSSIEGPDGKMTKFMTADYTRKK